MYKLSVPFLIEQIDNYGIEPFINKLKEIDANIAFLAIGPYYTDKNKREKIFSSLMENVPRLKKEGFTVGVWLWTFMVKGNNDFVHITNSRGTASEEQACPSDEDFCAFSYEYLQNVSKSKPDMILFDDDFRYGFLDCGIGCTCKNHRKYMSSFLGETLPEGDLSMHIFAGGKNKYRSAYLAANGHFLREFAKRSRAAVDSVDPDIRFGYCACMTNWDIDGVTAAEIARLLAGKTKPFCRLIGAPYWSDKRSWGNRLQDVIELERMESSWFEDDVELLAEGDVWPRPRFTCSANALEGFDMALRASGATDGIHKYTLDYFADVDYEQGYNKKHLQNRETYKMIDKHFSDKNPVGVRVYESMKKFEDMNIPSYYEGKTEFQYSFFSYSARMLAAQTIPTVYEGLGTVGIAFGENAKYLDEAALANGLILDVSAARILEKMGIDVGLASANESYSASKEYFPENKRYILLQGCQAAEISLKDGARVQSMFLCGEEKKIGSYTYENAAGQKFLVFAFDGYNMSEHAFKQSARGEQIEKWISSIGKKLPASMHGNPDCYMLCKENENEKAVWIGNFFADECMNTTVLLDKSYSNIEFIGCSGKLLGDKVEIDYIAPYASVGFAVK